MRAMKFESARIQFLGYVFFFCCLSFLLSVTSRGSRPSDKGDGGGGVHPDPEIRGPQFGPKIREGIHPYSLFNLNYF